MAEKSKERLVISDNINSGSKTSEPLKTVEPTSDLSKIINDSKVNLSSQPTKRTRRTKEQMAAQGATQRPQTINAQFTSQSAIPIQEQDFTAATEPLLKIADKILCRKYGAPELVSSNEELSELAKNINKPINVLLPLISTQINPAWAAAFTIVGLIGLTAFGKVMQYEELQEAKKASAT